MIDKFLAIGSIFDWITPLWAMYKRAKHRGIDCVVPIEWLDDVYSLSSIIDIWGIQIVDDKVVFVARKDDEAIIDGFLSNM